MPVLGSATRHDVRMAERILTDVSAAVTPEREGNLLAGFARLLEGEVPDGLLRTELLRGSDGRWHVQTLWRDREALSAMRASTDEPAAPALFRGVGAEPVLEIMTVQAAHPQA